MKFRLAGFTLIELIVTMAVIGILATIVYANFGSGRAAARDDIRQTSLKDLQLAIELYRAQNGMYPLACGGAVYFEKATVPRWGGSEADYTAHPSVQSCITNYITGLVPDYIETLPKELSTDKAGKGYTYMVNQAGTEYKLLSHHNVEVKFIDSYTDDFARYGSSTCSGADPYDPDERDVYAVYSAGAACW